MGLFSSTKYYVFVNTVNLLTTVPSTVADAAIAAANKNSNIAEGIRKDILSGFHTKVMNMWEYAANGNYHYGMPTFGTAPRSAGDFSAVQGVLEGIHGCGIEVTYVGIFDCDYATLAWEYLCKDHAFDPTLGILNKPIAAWAGSGSNYSRMYLEKVTRVSATKLRIHGYYIQDGVIAQRNTRDIIVPNVDNADRGIPHYHVCYFKQNAQGQSIPEKFGWKYNMYDNTYGELSIYNYLLDTKAFIPVVPIRQSNVDLTREAVRDQQPYITSKKMLGFCDLNIADLGSSLNDSPDIDDIDHAYVVFGTSLKELIHPDHRTDAGVEYLFEFLVYGRNKYTGNTHTKWAAGAPDSLAPRFKLHIRNAGLNYDISYDSLSYNTFKGNIGNIGDTQIEVEVTNSKYFWKKKGYNSVIKFRRQTSATWYTEVEVHNLRHWQQIQNRDITTTVADVMWDDDDNFIIPIDLSESRKMSLPDQQALYYSSFRMICQSWIKVKTGFFGSVFFKFILAVVAVVYVAMTTDFATVAAAFETLAAATTFVMETILPNIIISMAVGYVAKLLVEQIGGEFALIMGAIVGVVLAVSLVSPTFLPSSGLFSAKNMLMFTNSLIDAVNTVTMENLEDIAEDQEELNNATSARLDEITAAWEAFNNEISERNPFSLIGPQGLLSSNRTGTILPETPSQFINRCIHSNNIGVKSLDLISSYCDNKLKLPNSNLKEAEV